MIYIITAVALIGAYLNAKGDKRGFYFWIVSNSYLSCYNAYLGEYAQACLFLAYLYITAKVLVEWE